MSHADLFGLVRSKLASQSVPHKCSIRSTVCHHRGLDPVYSKATGLIRTPAIPSSKATSPTKDLIETEVLSLTANYNE